MKKSLETESSEKNKKYKKNNEPHAHAVKIYFIYRQGTAEPIELEKIEDYLSRKDGFIWVDIQASHPQKNIFQLTFIPKHIAKVLSALETRPRSEVIPEGLLLNLRSLDLIKIHMNPEPSDMISLRLWMNEQILVSVHRRPIHFMEKLISQINQDVLINNSIDILKLMLEEILQHLSDTTLELTDHIDILEDDFEQSVREKRHKLSIYRRQIISIRRYLLPQREALLRLPIDKILWLSDLQKLNLREASDGTTRVLEDLETAKDRSVLLQEELLNITQEQINNKIFLLSIVAVIFMPLSFITGLLGINVGGIPGAEHTDGFWVVCVMLAVLMAIEIGVLRYIKWV